jgi:uncharacterized protein
MAQKLLFCVITSVLFLIQSHSSSALAASFDCKKATTTAEKMICSNTSLSRLDEELAKVYLQTLASVPDQEILKREQRDWVKKKRNQCTSIDRLTSTYRTRISALTKELTTREKTATADGISGTWQELKPAAGGPFSLIIDKNRLRLTLCKKRVFKLQDVREKQYVFAARERGRCPGYSNRDEFNRIIISVTDEETIHARFYSGGTEKGFLGSDNFFNLGH